jgi:hypothetical protein
MVCKILAIVLLLFGSSLVSMSGQGQGQKDTEVPRPTVGSESRVLLLLGRRRAGFQASVL